MLRSMILHTFLGLGLGIGVGYLSYQILLLHLILDMSPFLSPPFIISILIALSVHEWAHAYAAWKLGDNTAKYEGRLTLNPMSHLDPLGTIMFLLVGFGWGKPVPVDPHYFKHPKRDNAIVALAGPLSNFVLAWIAFIGLLFLAKDEMSGSVMGLLTMKGNANPLAVALTQIFSTSLFINLALMAFNLLPIAPLDGSKILHAFIPYRHENSYMEFMQRGPMILLLLIIAERMLNIGILGAWVFGIIGPILASMIGIGSLLV